MDNVLQAVIDRRPDDFNQAFSDALLSKSLAALEKLKQDVAQTMFSKTDDDDDEEDAE